MASGIYKIVNLTNGFMYIGSATILKRRQNYHYNRLRTGKHDNGHLQNAFNKYGEDAFIFEVIEYCEPDQLLIREQFYLDSLPDCIRYNIATKAGAGNPTFTEEQRNKWSKARKGEGNPFYGRSHSKATKAAISAAKRGKGNGKSGTTHSEESKEKMRQAKLGIPKSESARKAMSEGWKHRSFNTHVCEWCKGEYQTKYSGPTKYCGAKCSDKARYYAGRKSNSPERYK